MEPDSDLDADDDLDFFGDGDAGLEGVFLAGVAGFDLGADAGFLACVRPRLLVGEGRYSTSSSSELSSTTTLQMENEIVLCCDGKDIGFIFQRTLNQATNATNTSDLFSTCFYATSSDFVNDK